MSTLESTPPTTERSTLPVPERDDLDAAGHAMAAFDAETAAEFAERWRDGQLHAAARLIRKHDAQTTGRLPVEARNEVGDCFARADKNAERAERYRAIRDGHSGAAVVRSEPRVYGPDSPNSYYIDVARSVLPGTDVRTEAARGNLARYARELEVEVKADSAEGRRAKRATRSRSPMPPGPERRAMDSTSTSGGSFVTPIHLMDLGQYGLYNSYPPAVVSQSVATPRPGLWPPAQHPGILLRRERCGAEWRRRQRRRVDHALSVEPASVPGDACRRNRGLPAALRPNHRPARRRD